MGYFSHWKLEILALLANLASLTTLIALLAAYDGKSLFNWHGITLNTLVSIISTAAKAPVLFIVAESISQWKWILFTEERHLLDFQNIDSASRGPFGSFKLFWKCKKESLLLLGALTTIFAIAIDPFTQQLVQFEEKSTEVESFDVMIPRATRYAKGSVNTGMNTSYNNTKVNGVWFQPSSADADFAMQAAVFYGLTHSVEDTLREAPFQCPTGNCSWDPFESLAVCSRCNDLSSMVQKRTVERHELEVHDRIIFELPNGLALDALWDQTNGSRVWMNSWGTTNASETVSLQDENRLIWGMPILRWKDGFQWPNATVEAIECGLHYCGLQYTPSVRAGTLREKEEPASNDTRAKDSWKPRTRYGYLDLSKAGLVESLAYINGPASYDRTDLELGKNFNISQNAVHSISSFFQDTFSTRDLRLSADFGEDIKYNGFARLRRLYRPSAMQTFMDIPDLTVPLQAVARSMSNVIRSSTEGVSIEHGRMVVSKTHYMVQWQWIILHCAFVLLGAAFLLLTIHKSKEAGSPVWTSNAIAALAVGGHIANDLRDANTIKELEKRARDTSAQLVQHNNNIKGAVESCTGSDEGLLLGDAVSTPRKISASDSYGNSEGPGSR